MPPRLLLGALLVCGCPPAAAPTAADPEAPRVERVELSFPREGEGTCTLGLSVSPRAQQVGAVFDLVWELWLEGRPFAAGVARSAEATPTPGAVTFKLPLAFRNVGWTADSRSVKVRLRGQLIQRSTLDTRVM